ncbi:MAG: hypothetical protein F4X57_12995 [Chloroflexi bacterium]|nr:hypothetical protein [Chloroflexota bacterium]
MEIASFIIGLGGLIVSGISLTLALKARSTAISAEKASDAARQAVFQTIAISELTQAIALVELLKELHKNNDFNRALDRYTQLRQLITALQTSQTEEDVTRFDNAIIQLMDIETTVRKSVYTGTQIDAAKIDSGLLKIQQLLDEARVKQEQRVTGASDIGGRS